MKGFPHFPVIPQWLAKSIACILLSLSWVLLLLLLLLIGIVATHWFVCYHCYDESGVAVPPLQ